MEDKSNEHIIQFGVKGWVISDLYSFLTGEPATYNIDAIEDAELLLISKSELSFTERKNELDSKEKQRYKL